MLADYAKATVSQSSRESLHMEAARASPNIRRVHEWKQRRNLENMADPNSVPSLMTTDASTVQLSRQRQRNQMVK